MAEALAAVICRFEPDARLPEDAGQLQAIYLSLLHEKKVLVLADNARDAAQVRPLLPPPGCLLLVTSRTRFTLPGLAAIDLDCLAELEAAELLQEICLRIEDYAAAKIWRAVTPSPPLLLPACGRASWCRAGTLVV